MKTSKIREQLSYKQYRTYHYVEALPSKEKWIVEHVSGSYEIESLKKPIAFEEVGKPNYDDIEWYDEFGVKSSNVDYTYDPDDYKYYKVTYEIINIDDEYNDMIESFEDYEYVYTDKYIKHDVYKLERDIYEVADEVGEVWGFDENENYYGDCWSDEVCDIKTSIEAKSLRHELKAEEYRDYLEAIRQEFDCCARSYLDDLKEKLNG